jgi:fibronectin-binding autotransporter adhesin
MKLILHRVLVLACLLPGLSTVVYGQFYTDVTATGPWSSARWNNSADGPTYTSGWTSNSNVIFTSGTYSFSGMAVPAANVNVGNVTVQSGANVTFTGNSGEFRATAVRTIDVAAGSTFDFVSQGVTSNTGFGLIKNSGGVLGLAAAGYQAGFVLNAGTVVARNASSLGSGPANFLTLNGGVIASDASLDFATNRFAQGITIGGNVQFGALSSNVSIAGDSANLSFANNVALGNSARTLTAGNNGNHVFTGVISGTPGGITFAAIPGTTNRFSFQNSGNTFTGDITIAGGEFRVSNDGSLGNTSNAINIDGGRLASANNASFALSTSRGIFVGDSAGTGINVVGSGTLTIDSVIANLSSDTGVLEKQGTGVLSLGGANTYTGPTTVTAGALAINGAQPLATGLITVNTGAALAGTGSTGGGVTLASGSGLLFGQTNLTVGGTISFGDSFGIANLVGLSSATVDGTYPLLNGTIDTSNLLNIGSENPFDLGDGKQAFFTTDSGLSVSVVPEPATGLAVAAGVGATLCWWRSRRPRST